MNKILSSVLIGAIASSVSIYAATAVVGEDVPAADRLSSLFINEKAGTSYNTGKLTTENKSSSDQNISIDLVGVGKPVKLVWKPFVNLTTDSKFTLRVLNGDFILARDVVLCNDGNKVGTMVSVGNTDGKTIMNNMSFQMDADLNASEAAKDSNITFSAGRTCASDTLLQITSSKPACSTISVEIPQAIDNSSQAFTDYTSPAIKVGETKRLVTITCAVPICSIDVNAANKKFTTTAIPTGINRALTSEENLTSLLTASSFENCLECDEKAGGKAGGGSDCITYITIKNRSEEFNITSGTVTTKFTNGLNADMIVDSNGSSARIGTLLNLDINVTAATGGVANIKTFKVKYTTSGAEIKEGDVTGDIKLMSGTNTLTTSRDTAKLATFKHAGETKFTVPYMNTSYKSMVKITTLSDSDATLSAVITDQNGKSTGSIDLGHIAPKATMFLFSTSGPLKEAADAAGLKNAWSVVFTTSAEATVVATMKSPDKGDRAIQVF